MKLAAVRGRSTSIQYTLLCGFKFHTLFWAFARLFPPAFCPTYLFYVSQSTEDLAVLALWLGIY